MSFIYNILVHFAYLVIQFLALFNTKMRLFVNGRNENLDKLAVIQPNDNVIWLHAASLGEFEQGRPILERLKKEHPTYKMVLTFFSPSGYEIRKNYALADVVCYLPFDTQANVKKFVRLVHPDLAIIVKYEFWPNLLQELKKTNTKTLLVSGIFRKNQSFFKAYGGWMRRSLHAFHHFFVQNESSKKLLNSIGFNNVTVSGDTRFDRVAEILQQDNSLSFISEFKNNSYTVVAGSTWKEDEAFLVHYINNHAKEDEKFIIAPHNIHQKSIEALVKAIRKKTVLFSSKEHTNLSEYQVLIVDTIGILTKIYAYANVAYVGGGLQTGLHNILEPATFGIPVIFGGNQYEKFNEATDLVRLGGCKTIVQQSEFSTIFVNLYANELLRNQMGTINKNYVLEHTGATDLILNYTKTLL